MQSEKMQDKFAILVDRARETLVKQNISSEDLKILVKNSHKTKLHKVFKKKISINTLFDKLSNIWSFFDYELVSLIIQRYCIELTSDLDIYISELKQYCRRRICEVPVDIFATKRANDNSLFVKCDITFDKMILDKVKDLESRLSELLDIDLYLLRIEEGCTQLVFNSLRPIFPLSGAQRDKLSKMQVVALYSVHYQSPKLSAFSVDVHDTQQDTPQDTLQDTPQDTQQDTPSDTPQDTPQDTQQDTPQDTQQDTQRDTQQDTLQNTPQDTQRDTQQDTQRDTQQDTPQNTLQDTQQDTQRDTSQDTSQDTPQDTPQDTSQDTPQDTPQDTSQDTPPYIIRKEVHTSMRR